MTGTCAACVQGYGIAVRAGGTSAVVAAVDDVRAVDLAAAGRHGLLDEPVAHEVLVAPSLNPLMDCGPDVWRRLGASAVALAGADAAELPAGVLVGRSEQQLRRPVEVGDYVDGYGGLHHAENLGRILRPEGEPLLPNWRAIPVAYHGRAGTVIVTGSGVTRPWGQRLIDGRPDLAPTERLDVELELGWVVGVASELGRPVTAAAAAEHVFGAVLVNDWSARDIQAFEYQPLGPFLGKSFATTMSAWVTPLETLRPHLVDGLAASQDPRPNPYLRLDVPSLLDLHLELALQSAAMRDAGLEPIVLSRVPFASSMYWSMPQQVAHSTVNGASLRVGDLFASGTVSGPDARREGGSLMELSWGGELPIRLPTGEDRCFLEDGDRVIMRGRCSGPGGPAVELGALDDEVRPAIGRWV